MYVLMKVLKLCTGSGVSSYQIKYAVKDRLFNMDPDNIGMGEAIKRVKEYVSIKNKFGSVHEDLAMLGITEVEVTAYGFHFVGYNKG